MKNLFSSLHFRLLLIVLFSLVPSLGLILYSTVELRLQAEREIQEEVGQLDHSISLEEDELIGGARQLLVSLGENQRLLTFDRNYSDSLLRNLMLYLPRYANIGGWVALGDPSPRAPTDPYVRDSTHTVLRAIVSLLNKSALSELQGVDTSGAVAENAPRACIARDCDA